MSLFFGSNPLYNMPNIPAPRPSSGQYTDAAASRDLDYMENRDEAYQDFFDSYKKRSYEADVETFNRSLMRTDVDLANSILKKLLDQWDSGIEEIQNPFYEGEENLVDFNEENNLSPLQEKTLAWKSAFPVTWRILSSFFGDDMSRSVDRPNFTTGHTGLFGSSLPEDEEVSVDSEFDGDDQGPLDPNVPGDSQPEEEGPTEEEAFLDSILEGFSSEEIRQQNEETLGELYSSLGFAEGEWDSVLGRKIDEEELPDVFGRPWWLDNSDPNAAQRQADLDRMLKDALDRLPGVGVVFEDGKMKGRILIPIPGLPTYIQGTGLEVDILEDGRMVITQNARNKLNEIKEKIKNIPGEIRDGIDSVIDGIREAGEEIGDIFTDNDGNIFVNVVDAAGSVLRRVSVTVGGLLDGADGKEGLLGWLLASGAIGSAVDTAKEKYFPPFAAEGEDDGTGTGDGTEDDGQPQEEPPPEDEKKGPPVTGDEGPLDDEDTSTGEPPSDEEPPGDDGPTDTPPEDTSDDDPFDGSDSSEDTSDDDPFDGSDSSEDTSDDGSPGGGGPSGGVDRPDPDDVEPEEPDEPVTGGGSSGGSVDDSEQQEPITGDDSEQQEPITGEEGMFTGLGGGGGSGGTGYMDNLGYGLPQFVAVPYQLKDYNVELNRLINDSLFKGII